MPADHREIVFEAAIEESLLTHSGFLKGQGRPRGVRAQTEATVLDHLLDALAARGSLDAIHDAPTAFPQTAWLRDAPRDDNARGG